MKKLMLETAERLMPVRATMTEARFAQLVLDVCAIKAKCEASYDGLPIRPLFPA
jgi:hypothetical protein